MFLRGSKSWFFVAVSAGAIVRTRKVVGRHNSVCRKYQSEMANTASFPQTLCCDYYDATDANGATKVHEGKVRNHLKLHIHEDPRKAESHLAHPISGATKAALFFNNSTTQSLLHFRLHNMCHLE